MKENEIVEIIEDRFEKIDKLTHKILNDFDKEDIHDFRVEVKKLRAFLRLLDIKKEGEPLIPKLLKTFYGYVGIVRDIQLHKHSLFKYITGNNADAPEAYIKILKDEEDHWKKEAEVLMKNNNFHDVKEKILSELPGKFDKSTIKKFTKNKPDELKEQLKKLDDATAIHNTRKILKDLFYNYDYIEELPDLPKTIAKEDALKSLTKLLGDYMDKYVHLQFFKPEYLDKVKDENEQCLLLKIKEAFTRDEASIKQQLLPLLQRLQKQL